MSIAAVEAWARSKIGCGYVYGATGWICSPARRTAQAAQYPEHKETIITTCAKWDGKQCFDCAQLVRYALKQSGVNLVSGATSQWKQRGVWAAKGEIADLPRGKLCALYRAKNDKVMQHTGLMLEDGTIIDARGSSSGVVSSALGAYPWTHWAIPDGFYGNDEIGGAKEMDEVLYRAKVVSANGKGVNLRTGPGTSYARVDALKTIPEGTQLEVIEETSATFWRVRVGEVVGYASQAYLRRIDENGEIVREDAGDAKVQLTLEITMEDARALFDQLKGVLGT